MLLEHQGSFFVLVLVTYGRGFLVIFDERRDLSIGKSMQSAQSEGFLQFDTHKILVYKAYCEVVTTSLQQDSSHKSS